MKVFISPSLEHAPYGILRVIEALHRHLPAYGIKIVNTESEADVVHVHATAFVETTKPTVYTSHGLYWGEMPWPRQFETANQHMVDYAMRANAITAVSDWVAQSWRRGSLRQPTVIYHGVDTDLWLPAPTNSGYVLWNKARADVVSNPQEMQRLAALMPDVGFVTTLGQPAPNVQVLGTVSHERMRDMVQQAGVYLATARETFGIGTLEALACGVPVVGWDHGGQREIIQHGYNGYLAQSGDYDELAEYVRAALADQQMRTDARESAVTQWQWENRIEQYAAVYAAVYEESLRPRPAVSVIITAHNLVQYLAECVESVRQQTADNWELLIIDDMSTDETPQLGKAYEENDTNIRYLRTPANLKLSGARNWGFSQAYGRYILFLDADDKLAPRTLQVLADALDMYPQIHIAYGHVDLINEDATERRRGDWPFDQFNWFGQMAHLNQLSYCSMMRREVMEQSGGYRERDWRAEDASFWCRVTSLGFRAAKVTEETTLIYRMRPDSKSIQERRAGHTDGDWTLWFPWRIAGTVEAGKTAVAKGEMPQAAVVPFAAQGRNGSGCWPIWSHHDPLVSVVIPVGPNHVSYLVDALDSVQSQTFPFWEAVVVNDTGKPLTTPYAPYARVVDNGTHNIADSRNRGVQAARGQLVFFLDADDVMLPNALYDMVSAFIEQDGSRYIYGDWVSVDGQEIKHKNSRDYDRMHLGQEGIHPVSILIPREWALACPYDPTIPGWEDWDFHINLAVSGYCGQRVPVETLAYRLHGGQRREQSLEDGRATLPILKERYGAYFTGERPMTGCCGGGGSAIIEAKQRLNLLERPKGESVIMSNGSIRIEYAGTKLGSETFARINGKKLTKAYKLGNNTLCRYADADPTDAKLLVEAGIAKYAKQVGFDMAQIQAAKTAVAPPQVPQFVKPHHPAVDTELPEPVSSKPGLDDISELSIPKLRESLIGLKAASLQELLAIENAKESPRKGAVDAIQMALDTAVRVGA